MPCSLHPRATAGDVYEAACPYTINRRAPEVLLDAYSTHRHDEDTLVGIMAVGLRSCSSQQKSDYIKRFKFKQGLNSLACTAIFFFLVRAVYIFAVLGWPGAAILIGFHFRSTDQHVRMQRRNQGEHICNNAFPDIHAAVKLHCNANCRC